LTVGYSKTHRRTLKSKRCRSGWHGVICVFIAGLLCTTIVAASPYSASTTRLSASGGAGAGGFGLGLDVGYFIYDGLETSIGVAYLNTDDLEVLQITPGARYILDLGAVDPYAGGFVRHWSFLGSDDSSLWSTGIRGGIILRSGKLFLGAGVVREFLLDCPSNIAECTQTYPEITFAVHL